MEGPISKKGGWGDRKKRMTLGGASKRTQ